LLGRRASSWRTASRTGFGAAGALAAWALAAGPAAALTTTVYAAVDNEIMTQSNDVNVAKTVYGNTSLGIGCNWLLYYFNTVPYQDFLCARSLVWFDIDTVIQGKSIRQARLRLYPYALPADLDTTYSAAPITSEWHYDTVTWSIQPTAGAPVDTIGPPVTTTLPMEFDVTSTVRDWANGTRTNFGFRIRDTNDLVFPYDTLDRIVGLESLEYWFGSSRRPQLYLDLVPEPDAWALGVGACGALASLGGLRRTRRGPGATEPPSAA